MRARLDERRLTPNTQTLTTAEAATAEAAAVVGRTRAAAAFLASKYKGCVLADYMSPTSYLLA